MTHTSISNSDDVIDSRDVIARIEELESEREDLVSTVEEAREAFKSAEAETALEDWDDDNGAELKALKALQDKAEGYSDWIHGATLIRQDYFPLYSQELLAEIGAIPRDLPDYIVIDWEATAENLEADYTTVDFDGTEYLIR